MRRLSPALLTIVMLGIVGMLVVLYVGKKMFATTEQPPADPLVEIPMALSDLKVGTVITEGHLATGRSRTSNMTREVVRSSRVLVGRVVKNPITAAQPIKTTDLFPPGEKPKPVVAPGKNLVTISLNNSTAVAESVIRPGDHVDVKFLPANFPNREDVGGLIITLCQGVRVVEMNGNSTGATTSSRSRAGVAGTTSLTLELTPAQSNVLLLAQNNGTLQFTYNPSGEGTGGVGITDEDRVTLYQILGIEPAPAEDPVTPAFVTEIFNGGGRQIHEFRGSVRADQYAVETNDSSQQRNNSPRYQFRGQYNTPGSRDSGNGPNETSRPNGGGAPGRFSQPAGNNSEAARSDERLSS